MSAPLALGLALLAGWLALARLHLGIANDAGSPDPASPFFVADPTLAQALYGRLHEAHPADHYAFNGRAGEGVRLLLLVPARDYAAGFQVHFTLSGPGLPPEGLTPPFTATPLTIVGRDYRLVQSHVPPLPADGPYHIAVRRDAGAGAYCLCLGAREGAYADAAMRQRIDRLLDGA
ncbi:MAG: hypothetical protein ACPL8I_11490 [Chloroflexaceae bacterium]